MASKHPDWLKVRPPGGDTYQEIKERMRGLNLHTVCEEAQCPNISECWSGGTATFMVLGDTCTRGCRFCAVDTWQSGEPVDPFEPHHVAKAVEEMELEYAVITSVDRDDLEDQGAGHFARTIEAVKDRCPDTFVEVLVPDFQGRPDLVDVVVDAQPDVIAQNIETVRRLTHEVRDPRAGYDQTLDVLRYVKEADPTRYTKSSIIVGFGESEEEVLETMRDLRDAGVDVLTLGQYLRPGEGHVEVSEYVHPDTFEMYREAGMDMGFLYVASGPFVRSSYKAAEQFLEGILREGRRDPRATRDNGSSSTSSSDASIPDEGR